MTDMEIETFLTVLRSGSMTAAAQALYITQPTLSYHVKQLCAAGLVSCRKDGRWMHYSANRETAAVLSDWISG